jgi:aconitate decarboxylase
MSRRCGSRIFRPRSNARTTHGAIEGVQVLSARHGFAAEDVEQITVTVPPLTGRLISRPDIADPLPNYARLCTAFVLGKVLQHGSLDLAHYRDGALMDLVTHDLAARVRVATDDDPDPNALVPQSLSIRLRDGRVLEWSCDSMLASVQRPLTHEQHLTKFRRCCEFAARRWSSAETDQLIEPVDRLETLADVRALTESLL